MPFLSKNQVLTCVFGAVVVGLMVRLRSRAQEESRAWLSSFSWTNQSFFRKEAKPPINNNEAGLSGISYAIIAVPVHPVGIKCGAKDKNYYPPLKSFIYAFT